METARRDLRNSPHFFTEVRHALLPDRDILLALLETCDRLTWQQMMEKTHTDEMLKRVAHREWQDTQRTAWMHGDTPQYTVPEDCPF